MKTYHVTKFVEVEYYYTIEAPNLKEAKRIAEELTIGEDSYQWQDVKATTIEKVS